MNSWWYIHTATLYQLSCRWWLDYIYIPQLCINFSAVEHLVIYTYGNFISISLQMNRQWYIHTATLYQLSCRWTCDDIYIPQPYINFPADEHVMIYTYRNFISTFLQLDTGWYIYIPQLYIDFPADEHVMIYIYIPQLYINFPADEHVMIFTYRNFISTFLHMNTWWSISTATLYQLLCRWTRDDMYIPKLTINFPAVVLVIIYT